ncbi:hypothetical protein B0A53_03595 [Rhodotorula sp. CCFEE 5036]|nr:hypothetical protein B0A53_03595 [Rhodotorula sp. CCFEE 5036]
MALRLLLWPAAVLNMIALAAATAPSDPREMALGPARLNQHDHNNNHARRAVHHHRKHLSRRRIKNESRREAPAYAARQVRDSREAHRRWFRRLEDDGKGELARRAAPSSVPVVCQGTVTAYQQCGGMGWSGDTCCIPGYTCVVSDAYYSQCRPVATTTTTSATTSTSSSASPTPSGCTGAQVAYGQCGGVGYSGDTCCPVAMQSRHVSVVVFDDHDQQLFDYDDEDDHDDFALRDAHGLFRSAGRIRSMRRHRLERSDLLYFGMDLHVLERLLLAMPSRCFIVDDADAELNVLLVLFVINNEIDIDNLDNDIDVEIDHLDDHLDDHHNFVC